MVVFGMSIFVKAVKVQVVEGNKWRSMADSLYYDYRNVKAERGNVCTENGSVLATSIPNFEIRMDLKAPGMTDELFKQHRDTLSLCLAKLRTGMYTQGGYSHLLNESRRKGNRYTLLAKNVTYPEVQEIKKFPMFSKGVHKGGLIVESTSQRAKPFKMNAHRTIGYIRDNAQPVGLEGAFDNVLAGEEGVRLMQRISGRTWIPVNDLTEIEPQNGKDIVTTLNIDIQHATEKALLKAIKQHNAKHGCAIVMEVKTGKIRAISNIGKTAEGNLWENYNYAVGESTQPGSTFKLAAVMALLEDGYANLDDTIFVNKGKVDFEGETMEDSSPHGHEYISLQKAFEISSNVGIAQLVNSNYKRKGGAKRFIDRLKQFRLHQPTGIEIKGEGNPFIKEAFGEKWSGLTLPWMSIGYELELTPLQLLTFYNAVANDGRMMKPYLVTEIQDYGKTIEKFHPIVLNRAIASQGTVSKAQQMLEGVVENGTAGGIKTNAYKIAGKTGTTVTRYQAHISGKKKEYQASFVGYFPADNPIYSCIVVVNTPSNGKIYGSQVAAPVFREIADKCYIKSTNQHLAINERVQPELLSAKLPRARVGYKEDLKSVLDYLGLPGKINTKEDWTYVAPVNDTLDMRPRLVDNITVPDVRGMGLRDAIFLLENNGLRVQTAGIGKVTKQSIKPGTKAKGQIVYINLK